MEGGTGDSSAREGYGFQFGDRGENAAATDLNGDIQKAGWFLFGWILEGDRPSGSP